MSTDFTIISKKYFFLCQIATNVTLAMTLVIVTQETIFELQMKKKPERLKYFLSSEKLNLQVCSDAIGVLELYFCSTWKQFYKRNEVLKKD